MTELWNEIVKTCRFINTEKFLIILILLIILFIIIKVKKRNKKAGL